MKRLVIVLFIVLFALTGCKLDNSVPVNAVRDFEEVQAEKNQLYRELDDENLWGSSYKVRYLTSCIDEKRPFSVVLLCKFAKENGETERHTIELGSYRSEFLGDFYREFYGESLIRDIAKNEHILRFNKEGYSVEILGGTISWSHQGEEYSLCDLNGDGQWDYAANAYVFFMGHISGAEPVYTFEDGYEVYLDCSKELVSCEGTERLSDIERRFR